MERWASPSRIFSNDPLESANWLTLRASFARLDGRGYQSLHFYLLSDPATQNISHVQQKDFFPLIGGGCNNGALQKQGFISLSSGELSHVD